MAKPSPAHSGRRELVALGLAVRRCRLNVGLSQESLAHDAEIDRSYVGGIERGEHNVSMVNLLRIATALGVRPSALLESAGL